MTKIVTCEMIMGISKLFKGIWVLQWIFAWCFYSNINALFNNNGTTITTNTGCNINRNMSVYQGRNNF